MTKPKDELAAALGNVSFHALQILISTVMSRSGWNETIILDRRETGRKSRHGGHEISCRTFLGPVAVKMVVKVHRDTGRTRMLDEMAGTVLRNGADVGLLVTPTKLSPGIAAKQAGYKGVRMESIDHEALASLMRCSGVGVRHDGTPDYEFLVALEEQSARLLVFMKQEGL
jgi:hypothetical protein